MLKKLTHYTYFVLNELYVACIVLHRIPEAKQTLNAFSSATFA